MKPNETLELLEACDELNIDELIEDLQNYLIVEKKEWIEQNLVYTHKISSHHQLFNLLHNYCSELFDGNPTLFLKSNDFTMIEKSMLISILERDDLELEEIDIWDCVVKWGIGQNEELKKDISEWKEEGFIELKNVIKDFIPLIRFNQISSIDFHGKILPFKKSFDKELYKGILEYYLSDTWQPKLLPQKGPRKGAGNLLTLQTKYLISGWIDYKDGLYDKNDLPYEFKLIYKGINDGFSRSVFEQKCYNIEQTVTIIKIKDTGELVGGYNPVCWNIKEKSLDEGYYIKTDKSFIFKINEDQISNSILSRVKHPKFAILHHERKVNETKDSIKFHEKIMDFCELKVSNSINNVPYCYYDYKYTSYENNLNFKSGNGKIHMIDDYEVYRIVKRN